MVFTPREKEIIREIHFSTNLTEAQVEECFHGLAVTFVNSLLCKKKVTVPFLGNFFVKYNGVERLPEGDYYNVDLFSDPSPIFKKIVGDVDEENTKNTVALTEPYKWLIKQTSKSFKRNINQDDTE